jgi:hypothetical protein
MHLVYYHLHFLGPVPRGLVKLPQSFSVCLVLQVLIYGVAD